MNTWSLFGPKSKRGSEMIHTTGPEWVAIGLIVVKTLVAVMGGTVTFFSYKAYRRTRSRSLGLLAAGFALVTLGAILGGTAYELLGGTAYELLGIWLDLGVLVEGLLVLAGFSLIAYSLKTD
jgi:hypothetical protein